MTTDVQMEMPAQELLSTMLFLMTHPSELVAETEKKVLGTGLDANFVRGVKEASFWEIFLYIYEATGI